MVRKRSRVRIPEAASSLHLSRLLFILYINEDNLLPKILHYIFITMGIKRIVRICGRITHIKEGDYMEFEPIGYGKIKLKKVKE